jgi:hypothetical protein
LDLNIGLVDSKAVSHKQTFLNLLFRFYKPSVHEGPIFEVH